MSRIYTITKLITVALFAGIIAITSLQIVARYFFHSPFVWAEELARYIYVWTVMFAGALALRAKAHLALDLFSADRIRGYARILLFVLFHACVLSFILVLMYFGAKLSFTNFKVASPAMQIPIGWPYLGLPVGAFVMLVFELEMAVESYRSYKTTNWGR